MCVKWYVLVSEQNTRVLRKNKEAAVLIFISKQERRWRTRISYITVCQGRYENECTVPLNIHYVPKLGEESKFC